MRKNLIVLLPFAFFGVFDAGYLTYQHYAKIIPPCALSVIPLDCGKVLQSVYSVWFGVPVALIGLIHYSLMTIFLLLAIVTGKRFFRYLVLILSVIGIGASVYFAYLMIFVLKAICLYCMASAVNSLIVFILVTLVLRQTVTELAVFLSHAKYVFIVKPFLFLIDPELVHIIIVRIGEVLGKIAPVRWFLSYFFHYPSPQLKQTVAGIEFDSPLGLAAGFDYEARLTQILPALGFGFQTVGTITNLPYEGNLKPLLGRLPQSRSLMVNKGFKNLGIKKTVKKLRKLKFAIPLGISIGRTNTRNLKKQMTQTQSVRDIVEAFKTAEISGVKNKYYELNISCPNLFGNVSFYPPQNLDALLRGLEKLKLRKPVFVKMPIEKSNEEILYMLKLITTYPFIKGVIFGNLQKNRRDPSLIKKEVEKYKVGYFSGKPTEKRSNELIALTYKHVGKKLLIIGCGGIFNAKDAYKKIKLGATLVQFITGMVYEGPQLATEIKIGLIELLKKDGYTHISEAIGRGLNS